MGALCLEGLSLFVGVGSVKCGWLLAHGRLAAFLGAEISGWWAGPSCMAACDFKGVTSWLCHSREVFPFEHGRLMAELASPAGDCSSVIFAAYSKG